MQKSNLDRGPPRVPKDPFTMRIDHPVDRISAMNGASPAPEMGRNPAPPRPAAPAKMPDPNPTRGEMGDLTLPVPDADAVNKGPTSPKQAAADTGIPTRSKKGGK